jgi:hypothetical protein
MENALLQVNLDGEEDDDYQNQAPTPTGQRGSFLSKLSKLTRRLVDFILLSFSPQTLSYKLPYPHANEYKMHKYEQKNVLHWV